MMVSFTPTAITSATRRASSSLMSSPRWNFSSGFLCFSSRSKAGCSTSFGRTSGGWGRGFDLLFSRFEVMRGCSDSSFRLLSDGECLGSIDLLGDAMLGVSRAGSLRFSR
ncbi:unnamed protein product [Periconia digitata]|uniref:Uncharacterized protein n=1 Tax=Periconia digitata TaxID=1303443 RepID=A0A9W4UB57_9PLEO|nr:unnamed protein product [Periconia digitata]